jgi:hypothetical protein
MNHAFVARRSCNQSSADFQVCCVADFQIRRPSELHRAADLEVGDTAGLETCATTFAMFMVPMRDRMMWRLLMNRLSPISARHFARWVLSLLCGFSFGAQAAVSVLDWQTGPNYRSAALVLSPSGKSGFSKLPAELTGITFTNLLAQERSLTNQMYLNGSGVAAGDIDGDGWCDLYFCGLDGPNVLYRNLGNWKFQDVTQTAGLACQGVAATGAALVDIDGDGDLDLIVTSLGNGTLCFRNDGKGHFTDVTAAVGLHSTKGGMSMALADIDGDGFLDLYVANYRVTALSDAGRSRFTFKVV